MLSTRAAAAASKNLLPCAGEKVKRPWHSLYDFRARKIRLAPLKSLLDHGHKIKTRGVKRLHVFGRKPFEKFKAYASFVLPDIKPLCPGECIRSSFTSLSTVHSNKKRPHLFCMRSNPIYPIESSMQRGEERKRGTAVDPYPHKKGKKPKVKRCKSKTEGKKKLLPLP